MKKVEQAAGGLVGKVRNRMRTVRKKLVAIAIAARQKCAVGEEKRRHLCKGLLSVTRKIVNQTQRVMAEVNQLGRRKKKQFSGLRNQLSTMVERVRHVASKRGRAFWAGTRSSMRRS
jgi:hypothetical protein